MRLNKKHITPIISLLLLLICSVGYSQADLQHDNNQSQPQKSAELGTQRSPAYGEVADYWQQQTVADKSNAQAWYNYYSAKRYAYYTATSNDLPAEAVTELDAIVDEMENAVNGSFEYHYVKYWNSSRDTRAFSHLEKAHALQPQNKMLYDDFVAHYELTGDEALKKQWCIKLKKADAIPDTRYHYNKNVLQSLSTNAILITNGEADTYPIWVLQNTENFRKDVTVLNLDLLENDDYRQRLWKKLGYKDHGGIKDGKKAFLKHLAFESKRPVYFGITVEPTVLKYFQNYLYCTGLAFKFNDGDYDNLPELQRNYEQNFNTAYIKTATFSATEAQMHLNYVMPLLLMREQYKTQNNTSKVQEVEAQLRRIAVVAGRTSEVEQYLND